MAEDKQIPIYDIVFDEHSDKDAIINIIAFTATPAIEVKGVYLEEQKQRKVVLSEAEEKMIVAAPILIPDLKIYRRDDEGEYYIRFSAEVIDRLQSAFKKNKSRKNDFNTEHTTEIAPAFLKEDWIVRNPDNDASNDYVPTKLSKGTWFGISQIEDKAYAEKVKEDELTGFSIEGILEMICKGFSFRKMVAEFKETQKQINKMNKKQLQKLSDYKLKDGSIITIKGDLIEGSEAYIDSVGVDAGDYELEDGTVITVGEESIISKITAPVEQSENNDEAVAEESAKEEKAALEITPDIQAKFDEFENALAEMQAQINELKSGAGEAEPSVEAEKEEQKMSSDEIKLNKSKSLFERLTAVQELDKSVYHPKWS